MERIRVEFLGDSSQQPQYATPYAAGADLKANLDAPIEILPGTYALVPTGICIKIPYGFEGQIRPRSGLALKKGLAILNAPGTIDSDYRGEVQVILINLGQTPATILPGDRIAQIVFSPIVQAEFILVKELESSTRGTGGFGSTG